MRRISRSKSNGCTSIGPSILKETRSILLQPDQRRESRQAVLAQNARTLSYNDPRVINVDKNAASPKAFAELFAEGHIPESCQLRQVKYLNNVIEHDHRFVKRLTKSGMGFFSFESAWRTLQGYEIMNMMRKGQLQGVAKGDVGGQVTLVAKLFGVAA